MAEPANYHDCDFCRKMEIDINRKQLNSSEKAPGHIVFFKPKFDALLSAAATCQFSQWLISNWSTRFSYAWEDLKARAGDISLCMDYLSYTFDVLPVVEIIWIGLWDPKEEFDEQNGRCRVQSRGYLDVIASAGTVEYPISPAAELSNRGFSFRRPSCRLCHHPSNQSEHWVG